VYGAKYMSFIHHKLGLRSVFRMKKIEFFSSELILILVVS